ncbi:MAG: nuclear transport factor 2 family protein [Planctomycetota bacterium]
MRAAAIAALGCLVAACAGSPPRRPDDAATARAFVDAIPAALRERGPLAWVELADPADFCMLSDGAVKFADHDALRTAMAAFAPGVRGMALRWHDLRVDPLGAGVAWFAAAYDESITNADGSTAEFAGCVSGVLRRTNGAWAVTRLHWSRPL